MTHRARRRFAFVASFANLLSRGRSRFGLRFAVVAGLTLTPVAATGLGGCKQIIGWQPATVWDGGPGGSSGGTCAPGSTQACPYTGPNGTEGVGNCKSGSQTCASDGQSWGPCEGEVLPVLDGGCATSAADTCSTMPAAGCCTPGAEGSCYDGPAGTEGTGTCKGGMETCGSDGVPGAACTGEVTPQQETCANPADENCDGFDCVEWAELFGNAAESFAGSVATDADGNIFITGQFFDMIPLGGSNVLQDAGSGDIFVIKLDATGKVIWGKSYGDPSAQLATAIAMNPSGQPVIGAYTQSALTLTTMAGSAMVPQGLFVATLDPSDGSIVWVNGLGGGTCSTTSDAAVKGLAFTSTGDVAIAGAYCGNFGSGALPSFNGAQDGFVALLDGGTGSQSWAHVFGDGQPHEADGVAVDLGGNIVATGAFKGSFGMGTGFSQTSAGGYDAFIITFLPTGQPDFFSQYGDALDQYGRGIVADRKGNLFTTGSFLGSINFGPTAATNVVGDPNDPAGFIVELDSGLGYKWVDTFGGTPTNLVQPSNIALDSSGNIGFTGIFAGSTDFGTGPLGTGTDLNIVLAKYDGTGKALWAKAYDSGALMLSYTVGFLAFLPTGEEVLAGATPNPINFGTGVLKPAGSKNIFVAKFGI